MSLTYNLKSARDLLGKVKRDAGVLDDQVTSDRFFNFIVTSYSLIDWVKNDPTVPQSAKAKTNVDRLYDDLNICKDIANASKHFHLNETTRSKSETKSVTSNRGWGAGRFGKGRFGVGEEGIQIILNDGTTFGALELRNNILRVWDDFFATHHIG